jgi:acyl-CoA synthetase (AMP-forming)/AMP-acid ligase II
MSWRVLDVAFSRAYGHHEQSDFGSVPAGRHLVKGDGGMLGLMMDMPLLVPRLIEHAAAVHGDRQIVTRSVEGPIDRSSYAELAARARRLARALLALGVAPGDRVATLAWNTRRHVEVYYAVSGLGAICHTVNPRLHATDVAWILNDAEDVVVFADTTFLPLLEAALPDVPSVRHIVVMTAAAPAPAEGPLAAALVYEDLLGGQGDRFEWPTFDENTAAVLCYTSGTTGRPKGVLYSHRSQLLHAYAIALPDTCSFSEKDSVLPVVPMFHVNAWGVPYAAAMTGAKLVLPGPRLDGEALAELIEAEAVTLALGVPSVWIGLLDHLRGSGRRLPTLQRVVIGGAAAPRPMIEAFEKDFGVEVRHAWGMTEMSPLGTVGTLKSKHAGMADAERFWLSEKQGRPVFGVQLEIVDDGGRALPHDGRTAGALKVRGPWVCRQYFGHPPSEAADADGWFSTGDIATIDGDGYLQITDRAKDIIKSGGEWISSIELERLALEHPDVVQAAAIGVPDERWGERPVVVVVRRPGSRVTEAGILAVYQGRIAKWCIPDRVILADSLPLGATGKVQKNKLRELYARTPTR